MLAGQLRTLMGLETFRLDGKVAWISGGTKGLGLQMANALVSVGAAVVASSRHGDEAAAAAGRRGEVRVRTRFSTHPSLRFEFNLPSQTTAS